jgi:N-acetylneuraminic acid mutarotase
VRGSTVPLKTVEIYDPSTDKVSPAGDMNRPRYNFAAAAVNGKVYVFGGFGSSVDSNSVLASVEQYDPSTNTWTEKRTMVQGRHTTAAAAWKGRIYVLGGTTKGRSAGGWLIDQSNSVEIYTP